MLRMNGGTKTDAFRKMFDLDEFVDEPIGLGVFEGGWHIVIDAKEFANNRLVLRLRVDDAGDGKSIEIATFTCGL